MKTKKVGTNNQSAVLKRAMFVEAYLSNDGNATQAALTAGYSRKTAASQGSRLLKDVNVRALIDSRTAEIFDNLKITTERILLERARLAFFDPRKLLDKDGNPIPLHELDDDTAAVICGLDVMQIGGEDAAVAVVKKYKLANKDASLTSLEKQRGMYREDNEQSRPVTKVVMVPPKKARDDG